jgi:hypothetical protein
MGGALLRYPSSVLKPLMGIAKSRSTHPTKKLRSLNAGPSLGLPFEAFMPQTAHPAWGLLFFSRGCERAGFLHRTHARVVITQHIFQHIIIVLTQKRRALNLCR